MKENMTRILLADNRRAGEIKKIFGEEGIAFRMEEESKRKVGVSVPEIQVEKALSLMHRLMENTTAEGLYPEENLKKYRKILVPVDFREYSENACYLAIGLAERLKAEIGLLHAFFTPDLSTMPIDEGFSFQGTLTEYMKEAREAAAARLEELTGKLQTHVENSGIKGVEISYSLLRGLPADAILYMEETWHPDVIVIGTRSLEKRKEEDSSVLRVIRDAGIPVLVVPENTVSSRLDVFSNIAFATDFDESDFGSIRKLFGLISPFGLKVYCVHIGKLPVGEEKKNKMRELQKYFTETYPGSKVECILVENQDVVQGLDETISRYKIDVLAVTTRKRNLITQILYPSLTRKLFFHTGIPLLVFHS